jgi:hypothetical protein
MKVLMNATASKVVASIAVWFSSLGHRSLAGMPENGVIRR